MNIGLDIPVGKWRDFTKKELDELNALLEDSTKTEEASLDESLKKPNRPRKRRPRKDKS